VRIGGNAVSHLGDRYESAEKGGSHVCLNIWVGGKAVSILGNVIGKPQGDAL